MDFGYARSDVCPLSALEGDYRDNRLVELLPLRVEAADCSNEEEI